MHCGDLKYGKLFKAIDGRFYQLRFWGRVKNNGWYLVPQKMSLLEEELEKIILTSKNHGNILRRVTDHQMLDDEQEKEGLVYR